MRNPTCPFAHQRLLVGEEEQRSSITPTATALHVAASTAAGDKLGDYFDRESVKEDSTFYVDLAGGIWQYRPVDGRANAQNAGNHHVVSIETAGEPGTTLNDKQLESLVRLYVWLYQEWGLSLEVSSTADGAGAGWHSKYPSWNVNRHNCPGPIRVKQLLEIVLPRARQTVQEDDMPLSDADVERIAEAVAEKVAGPRFFGKRWTLSDVVTFLSRKVDDKK